MPSSFVSFENKPTVYLILSAQNRYNLLFCRQSSIDIRYCEVQLLLFSHNKDTAGTIAITMSMLEWPVEVFIKRARGVTQVPLWSAGTRITYLNSANRAIYLPPRSHAG